MICLIPVSRFRVRYEVGAGRPYSQLEAMVLQAIMEGVRDVARMRATFQVHPRILIEALVTLTQAGWVSFSSQEEGGFLLTSEGMAAIEDSKSPSTSVISSRSDTLLLERVTGSLVSNEEVRFKTRAQLKTVWDDAVRLRAAVHEGEVDEGQVRQLLRRRQGEWVRWVGPIELIGKNAHWVPVSVDTATGALIGLPDRWRTRLGPDVLSEARGREGALSPEARSKQWVVPATERSWGGPRDEADSDVERVWPVNLGPDDVLWDAASHETVLLGALAEAVSSIFVASAFLNAQTIEALRGPILSALRRGVDVDLLWGYGDGSEHGGSGLEELKKIAYTARRDGLPGALRFNRDASGSHAKLLLSDASGSMQAVVGSYNWLSALHKGESTNVSVRLKHPGIIADTCACAAGLWASIPSEALSSTPDRWRTIASEQERIAVVGRTDDGLDAEELGLPTAQLVLDREHDAIVRQWSATAQERLLVLSHRLGPAGETRLMRTEPAGSRQFVVRYGLTDLDEEWVGRIETLIRRAGGQLVKVPGMHAKVVVSDASVCVSSYNFLSADPFGTSRRAREVGVVIEGGSVASTFAERLGLM